MNRFLHITIVAALLPSGAQSQIGIVNAFPHLSFAKPIGLYHAGDGSNRLFVIEQEGRIRVFPNDSTATSTKIFLDITDSVYYVNQSEMGLLGLAFHPDYSTNGLFYVHYIKNNPRRSVFARYEASTDPDSADRSTETILFEVNQPYNNHNGGQLAFGPDGFLYIALGDGGDGGDPLNNAQTLTTLLGKILRIDIDNPEGETPYGIPPDNPFVGSGTGYREEIYAYGLRNPWRFSFDFETGQLWCADVGQATREEINIIGKGRNYGWRIMEGTECYNPPSGCDTSGLTLPLWDYPREVGGSVTGGFVYRGTSIPELSEKYVFGDYVSGYVAALQYDGMNPPTVSAIGTLPSYSLTSFGVDESGEIYLCSFDGSIFRLRSTPLTSVSTSGHIPSVFLHQNFPNPFNSGTNLRFHVPTERHVSVRIYDQLGREIGAAVDRTVAAGDHLVYWDASGISSGVYFYRIYDFKSGLVLTETMLLIR